MGGRNPYFDELASVTSATRKFKITFLPMNLTIEVDPEKFPLGDTGLPGSILDVALKNMLSEGMENIFQRHVSMARRVREGIENLGLSLLVTDPNARADTVTAVRIPEGVDSSKFMAIMREDFNIVLGGGQGKLKGKI